MDYRWANYHLKCKGHMAECDDHLDAGFSSRFPLVAGPSHSVASTGRF
jgi:hypothetical protein